MGVQTRQRPHQREQGDITTALFVYVVAVEQLSWASFKCTCEGLCAIHVCSIQFAYTYVSFKCSRLHLWVSIAVAGRRDGYGLRVWEFKPDSDLINVSGNRLLQLCTYAAHGQLLLVKFGCMGVQTGQRLDQREEGRAAAEWLALNGAYVCVCVLFCSRQLGWLRL